MLLWPRIDTTRCTGCGWCVGACPPHVLSLHQPHTRKQAVLHEPAGCTGCRLCERRCPFDVIDMVPPEGVVTPPARRRRLTGPPADRS